LGLPVWTNLATGLPWRVQNERTLYFLLNGTDSERNHALFLRIITQPACYFNLITRSKMGQRKWPEEAATRVASRKKLSET